MLIILVELEDLFLKVIYMTPANINGVNFIAPDGFFEHAVSENLMAGNAMNQRASFMYGNACGKNKYGTVGSGLGQTTSEGTTTIMEPTRFPSKVTHFLRHPLRIQRYTYRLHAYSWC